MIPITNPYKRKGTSVLHRKVLCDVGQDDWNMIFVAWPFRGMQDAILSNLFKAFADEVRTYNIPKHYDEASRNLFRELLEGITFPRIDRSRHWPDDGGRETNSSNNHSAEAAEFSDSPKLR